MLVERGSFTYGGMNFRALGLEHVGDELPLHSHDFDHLMQVLEGVVEVFDDAGKARVMHPLDAPLEFKAGRLHGVRALSDGAAFQNISVSA